MVSFVGDAGRGADMTRVAGNSPQALPMFAVVAKPLIGSSVGRIGNQ